jgi:hypothetical protein
MVYIILKQYILPAFVLSILVYILIFQGLSSEKESFIFRYFKDFQLSQMFTCGLFDLLLLAVGSLVVFVLREYILKVHILVSSEHILCQTWNTCIYWSIAFFKQIVDIFFNKAYYQESYILIIEYSSG